MQLNYLKYLIAIKKYGSMNKAAEHLFVTQQNISKAIKKLEAECGFKIFSNSNKNSFTEKGKELYELALFYEESYEALKEHLAVYSFESIKGTVRIGACNTAAMMVLPQVLAKTYEKFEHINLKFVDGVLNDLVKGLLNGEVDLALAPLNTIDGNVVGNLSKEITVEFISETRSCCWVSKRNDLSKKSNVTIDEIAQYPIISSNKTDFETIKNVYKLYGQSLNNVKEEENLYLISQLLINNQGVMLDMSYDSDKWPMSYFFDEKSDVVPVPVQLAENHQSGLFLLTNRSIEQSVATRHIVHYVLSNIWKE